MPNHNDSLFFETDYRCGNIQVEEDLFEDLYEKSGLMYLSDMKKSCNFPIIILNALELVHNNYSIEEWNKLAKYIFNDNPCFQNNEDMVLYFCEKTVNVEKLVGVR